MVVTKLTNLLCVFEICQKELQKEIIKSTLCQRKFRDENVSLPLFSHIQSEYGKILIGYISYTNYALQGTLGK